MNEDQLPKSLKDLSTYHTAGVRTIHATASGVDYTLPAPFQGGQGRLFSNEIDTSQSFGISRKLADNLKKLTDEITPSSVKEKFIYGDTTFRSGKDGNIGLRVIDEKREIKTADQLYKALTRIKSGKVLQTLLALWNYGNQQGSFIFNGTKLNELMATVLKPPSSGYFTQGQRKDFTEAIHRLRDFEIYLDQTIEEKGSKGKKKPVIKRDFYKLIDLMGATYTKRNKDVIDPETGRVVFEKGTADESVIIRLYGELLPRFNKGIMRGRLYSRGLLELDANKDETAIILGFRLLTRFDQLRQGKKGSVDNIKDENLYIRTPRKTLIEWAEYTNTDLNDKWTASRQLEKTLNKLIEANCLRGYSPTKIETRDDQQITLYPSPIAIGRPNDTIKRLKETKK